MKALLEQPNGLARRIIAKAGSNPSMLLERTEDFIRQQPKVSGSADQARLGTGCHSTLAWLAPSRKDLTVRWACVHSVARSSSRSG